VCHVYNRYFQKRFPRLFLTCYAFALARLTAEPSTAAYFPTNARELMAPFFSDVAPAQVILVASRHAVCRSSRMTVFKVVTSRSRIPAVVHELMAALHLRHSGANLARPLPLHGVYDSCAMKSALCKGQVCAPKTCGLPAICV
jgi:hypothetical protein